MTLYDIMKKDTNRKVILMKSKKKFAMMMMDAQYDTKRDYAVFETEEVETHMITVNSPEQAVQMAKELAEQGFGAIEVCGAFGEELARKMYEATENKVSVGYIVCPSDQKELSDRFGRHNDLIKYYDPKIKNASNRVRFSFGVV